MNGFIDRSSQDLPKEIIQSYRETNNLITHDTYDYSLNVTWRPQPGMLSCMRKLTAFADAECISKVLGV
jgi:hypothetical protein